LTGWLEHHQIYLAATAIVVIADQFETLLA
jgi:hypothetical protein